MWRDCSDLLQAALGRFPRNEFFPGEETETIRSTFEEALRDPGLQRPRPPVLADLGSPIAFALGKAYLAAGGPGPEAFAARLLQCLSEDESKAFTFTIARGGYINIEFSDAGKDEFVTKLFSLPFSEILPGTIEVSESEVRERASLVHDEFLKGCLALPPSRPLRMMVLGILAEPELDLEPFLRGLSGKQNLPWLFERFSRDLAHVRGLLASPGESSASSDLVSDFLRKNRDHLIWLRWSWEKAVRLRRPEEYFGFLLALVHANYSFLNRPDFRLSLQSSLDESKRQALLSTFHFLEALVPESLARLTDDLSHDTRSSELQASSRLN